MRPAADRRSSGSIALVTATAPKDVGVVDLPQLIRGHLAGRAHEAADHVGIVDQDVQAAVLLPDLLAALAMEAGLPR